MTASREPAADAPGAAADPLAPAPVARGRMPDFFIVGHPKSGTTALYEMLRSHPEVFMPALKEPRWFAPDLRGALEAAHTHGPRPQLPATLEEYLELFAPAGAGQRVGEASPSYLRSAEAAGLIAAARPDARIIAILREPASFLRSLQLELIRNQVETERDLARALAGEDRASGSALPRYTDRVRYVEQLRRFAAVFPAEQMLVLIYDDFRADNLAVVRRVLSFIGVDESLPLRSVEANASVEVRAIGADRLLGRVQAAQGPVARALKRAGGAVGLRRATLAARKQLLYGDPEPLAAGLNDELRRRFEPEVRALSEYLGRDLIALWGYDQLG